MHFEYCPKCGSELTGREIGDEGKVPFCGKCGVPWFDMFSSCVIVLVVNEKDEAALLRQAYISEAYYNLVSGYMKPGETAELTAKREVFEEIGVKLDTLEFAGTYWFGKKDMLMIGFIGRADKKELILSGEVDGAKWVPVEKAIDMVHPEGSVSYALVKKYLERGKSHENTTCSN